MVDSNALDSKARFTDRVGDYVRYRPGYPAALLDLLRIECGLGAATVVADVGSGTGILTRMLLAEGARVEAIEPNAVMRAAAESALSRESRFRSIDASAEETSLESKSVDLVTAAQAFHWFNRSRVRAEFERILKPRGWVALVWNDRKETPLNRDYEDMLERFAPAYASVRERDRAAEADIRSFFAPETPRRATFDNEQRFDEAGLLGRLASSSYVPREGQPGHEAIVAELRAIYRAHQQSGQVTLAYDTVVWYGRLPPRAP